MSNLSDCMGQLHKVMLKLKDLRDEVATKGETRMAGWLQMVEDKEGEVSEMEMKLPELEKSRSPSSSVAKAQLEQRIRKNIIAVKALIERKDEISLAMEMFISEVATGQPTKFPEGQLKNYTSNYANPVGSGDFGIVYKGVFRNNVEIAVKVLGDSGTMDNLEKQFKAEVNTMSRTSHRNLAKLYGYCFDPKKKALVYEYVDNSLDKVLYDRNSGTEWGKLYKIAIDTAKGLSYLHENCDEHIIHRNIKASNVLLDSNFCPKLTDFGLAKFYATDMSQAALSSGFKGVRHYDAPELRFGKKRKVSYKCDVFSFGVMLFEFLSRKKCEGDDSFATHVWDMFQNKLLDEFILTECGIGEKDKENAKTLSLVALLCIEHRHQDRPSMSKVVNILMDVIKPSSPRNPFLSQGSSSERILSFNSTGESDELKSMSAPEADDAQEVEVKERLDSISESNGEDSGVKQEEQTHENGDGSTFPYYQLKTKSADPVTGIDFKRREAYLSDEDFQTVMGMTKEAFYRQPRWKQDMQKRKVELF